MASFLVIGDDRSLANLVQMVLESAGFEIAVAGSVRCALDAIETMNIDVILVDTSMAAVKVRQAIIAARRRTTTAPIIVAASHGFRRSAKPANGDVAFIWPTPVRANGLLTVTRLVSTPPELAAGAEASER